MTFKTFTLNFFISFSLLLFCTAFQPLMAQSRHALVIGNSNYESSPLANPANDAQLMASNLKKLGFKVILKIDASQRMMDDSIEQFGRQLEDGGVGLFFYAGHGIQSKGRNYLIPINARLSREKDLKYNAVDAGKILDEMGNAKNGLNIVILDACRDNPLSRSFRSKSRGLSRIDDTPSGLLLAYSTAPGSVAADGTGKNSPYTEALVAAMQQPGRPLELVFKNALKRVKKTTRGKQIPWFNSSVEGDFYFKDRVIAKKPKPKPQPKVVIASADPDTASKYENNFWRDVKADPTREMYQAYLDEYPNGFYSRIARIKLKNLSKPKPQPIVKKSQTGAVSIRSNVRDGIITINGEQKGKTNLDLSLKPGLYALEVRKEGYDIWKKNIQIRLGDEQIIYAKLRKIQVKPQISTPFRPFREDELIYAEPRPTEDNMVTTFSQPSGLESIRDNITGMEFIKVASGCFKMGSNYGSSDEKPVHRVCLTQDYYIGKFEVTQGQWKKIMGSNPSNFKKCGDNCPVEMVSWNKVQKFISKLNARTGQFYRLPTEAEWEYACRSGGKKQKFCGSNSADPVAWYRDNAQSKTHPVGKKQANGLGLYDMSGNVWEWVHDKYDANYYENSPEKNPKGSLNSPYRGNRGGSWSNVNGYVRSGLRYWFKPSFRHSVLGFRLALSKE